jgi:hypothetical protein
MKITKISNIPPLNLIPREHQRWCGLEEEKEERKKTPEILEGELILYNRYGKIEKHGCSEKGVQDDN